MKFLHLIVISLCFFYSNVHAEVWAYSVTGKQVSNCERRTEKTIDEVWDNLERATGLEFDISRDIRVIPGYIMQNRAKGIEFTFYPSQHSCAFERAGIELMLSGDIVGLKMLRDRLGQAEKRAAMSPADIDQKDKQVWINFFAGCTDSVLKSQTVLKGGLQRMVDFCDCVARKEIGSPSDKRELNDQIVNNENVIACLKSE
ncbi:hypothetical protein KSF73_06565 [Burkholderiaceae bacterium DAT-1]|nr:hypothetical protein [Burkholderiaceae bacterium DAT-1]